jgi:hypothetical protein
MSGVASRWGRQRASGIQRVDSLCCCIGLGLDVLPDGPLEDVILALREKYDRMEAEYKHKLSELQDRYNHFLLLRTGGSRCSWVLLVFFIH